MAEESTDFGLRRRRAIKRPTTPVFDDVSRRARAILESGLVLFGQMPCVAAQRRPPKAKGIAMTRLMKIGPMPCRTFTVTSRRRPYPEEHSSIEQRRPAAAGAPGQG